MKYSKIVVSFIILSNVIFTYKILEVFTQIQEEPVTLIAAWFAFTTGELFALAKIRTKKIDKECDKEEIHAREINE